MPRKAKVTKSSLNQTQVLLTEKEEATASTLNPRGDIDAFIRQAMARFHLAEDAEMEDRKMGLTCTKFRIGDQWPVDVKAERALDGRPVITVNRVVQFLRQVENEERENRPANQVNPVGDGADVPTAQVIQGMLRHIEIKSEAERVYSNTFSKMLTKGWSWMRVIAEWESEVSTNQTIRIRDIPNDFMVYCDPTAILPDRSDANWLFIAHDMPNGEYKEKYGELPGAGLSSTMSIGDGVASWKSSQTTRVAEYFYYDVKPDVVVRLADGSGKLKSELNGTEALWYDEDGKPFTRPTQTRQLKWCIINAERILEGNKERTAGREFPCKWIPVVPMIGDEVNVDGNVRRIGMVEYALDSAKMYNYWNSAMAETIALAPKSPFIIASGQLEGFDQFWKTANRRNWPYLPYKFTTSAGQPAPVPQRSQSEPPIVAMNAALHQADQDLMATMGIYQAGLGAVGPERSGKAILARQRESDVANANYGANRNWSILHVGRICLDMMPTIYSGPRAVQIVRPNNETEMVVINQLFQGPDGKMRMHDLEAGEYAVTLSVGASTQSRRQEQVGMMLELCKQAPEIFMIIGDLLVEKMDWPGAQDIAQRLRKALPPNLQDDEGDQAIPPQVQAQIQAMMAQLQALTEALNKAQEIIQTKQIESASKEKIEQLRIQAQIAIESAKIGSEKGMKKAELEYKRLTDELNRQHEEILAEIDATTEVAQMRTDKEIAHIQADAQVKAAKSRPKPTSSKSSSKK